MLYDNSQLARVYLNSWILTSFRSQAVTGNEFFRTITEEILDYVMREMLDIGFGQWIQALAYALSKSHEIAIVGAPDSAGTQALLSVVRDGYRPSQVMAMDAPSAQLPAVPLLQHRGLVDGQAAAYVCRDFTCEAPVTTPEALELLPNTRREKISFAVL